MKCGYCGEAVPAGRTKYCSTACGIKGNSMRKDKRIAELEAKLTSIEQSEFYAPRFAGYCNVPAPTRIGVFTRVEMK